MEVAFKKDITKQEKVSFSKNEKLEKFASSLWAFFLFLVVLGLFFFGTALVFNRFTTPFSGDYCAQQFSFYTNGYDDWWHFFKTGEFVMFDQNTFLGVNNVGSNSFYYLFDPFFLPILLFPRQIVPQGMAILTIFKIALAGLAFYAYLRVMKVSKNTSKLASTAYAFCGWMAWYLWFNHFTEVMIVFPLILLGVEKVLRDKNPIILGASLFLAGLTNFFFLFTFALCGFIYAMVRFFQRLNKHSGKDNWTFLGLGFVGFLSGLMMSCIVVLPAALVAMQSDRVGSDNYLELLKTALTTGNLKNFFDYMFSWKNIRSNREFRSLFPFVDFFYPVMSDRGTPLTKFGNETYDNVAGSLFCYSPFIILLTPALITSCKEKKFSPLIITILFIISLCTPFCYYLFHGFTQAYSRWTLFVTTSLIAYVAIYIDKIKESPKWMITIGGCVALVGVFIGALAANIIISKSNNMKPRVNIVAVMLIEAVYVAIITAIIRFKKDSKSLHNLMITAVAIEAIIMGATTVMGHGTTDYVTVNNGLVNNNALHQVVNKVNKSDSSYFRSMSTLASDSAKNDGMRNGYNGASFFHSVYNFNLVNFLEWSKIPQNKNGWSGTYVEKRQNLDTFLGMKYRYVLKDSLDQERLGVEVKPNVPLGYVDVSNEFPNDKFYVYENKEHIDLGFTFDNISPYNSEELPDGFMQLSYDFHTVTNEENYLKTGILNYEDAAEVKEQYPDLILNPMIGRPDTPVDAEVLPMTIYGNTSDQYKVRMDWHSRPFPGGKYDSDEELSKQDFTTILETAKSPIVAKPAKNDRTYLATITNNQGGNLPYDPTGMIYYVDVGFARDSKCDVYFVDEFDKLIVFDRHCDNNTMEDHGRKKSRGYYIHPGKNGEPAPKVKMIIIVPRWNLISTTYPVAFESYGIYNESKMNDIRNYPLENVKYSTNKFTFTTNFDKNRFVCTQMAFDDGWSVKAKLSDGTSKNLKTYLTQGGFVGFVAEKGATSYTLSYYTPFLALGSYISAAGLFIYYGTTMGYIYLSMNQEKKRAINSLNLR